MKRLFALILAVTMMVSVTVGCSSPAASSTSTSTPSTATSTPAGGELTGTLKIWTHQNPAWSKAYQVQIDKFVAMHPGVKIEQESFPYSDFQSKLQTSLVSGNGADIYVIFGSWAADYMPTGALAKVPDNMAAQMKEDYYAPTLGGFTHNDAYYGIPIEYNIEYGGMLVNKKLFDEKKLAYPTTWADLEKVSDATAKRNGELMEMRGFEFATYDGLTNLFLAMILQKGGKYIAEDGKTVDFSTPEAIDSMTTLVDYVKTREWTNLDGLGGSGEGGYAAIFKDNAMMNMVGPWAIAQGSDSYDLTYGVDYDYIPLPVYGDKNLFTAETGWGFIVPENSKQKELAWAFLEFFSQPENLMEHNILCTQLPPRKSIAADPAYLEAMPYTKPLIDILEGGQYVGYFNTDIFKQNLNGMFTELTRGNKYATVADGLKDFQTTMNTLTAK